MLDVQTFLLTHSLKDLYDIHGVASRFSVDHSKISLNYDQIAAKSGDVIAEQCRGLIVRPISRQIKSIDEIIGETTIVARPMDRFYNAGDPACASVSWKNGTRIQEKLDGTMCALYFDYVKDSWCVATRSVPEADLTFGQCLNSPLKNNTYFELFKHCAVSTILDVYIKPETNEFRNDDHVFNCWLDELDRDVTYIYEVTAPLKLFNNVPVVGSGVIKYDDYRITLLAARVTATGVYKEYTILNPFEPSLQRPVEWKINDLNQLIEFVDSSDPSKIEGAVVVDENYNRIKVKNKTWVLASRAKDLITLSKRNALEAIINGTIDDVIPLLNKELVDYVEQMRASLIIMCTNIDQVFHKLKLEGTRKDFAIAVKKSGFWEAPLFVLYSGHHQKTLDWLQSLASENKLLPTTLDAILTRI